VGFLVLCFGVERIGLRAEALIPPIMQDLNERPRRTNDDPLLAVAGRLALHDFIEVIFAIGNRELSAMNSAEQLKPSNTSEWM
jgi:hypothetical protein